MALLLNAARRGCSRYVSNAFLAPGTWNAPGFGNITEGSLLPLEFYIWYPSLLLQDEADRAARIAPLIHIAAKCAGVFHQALGQHREDPEDRIVSALAPHLSRSVGIRCMGWLLWKEF